MFSADTTQRDVSITITDDRVNEPLEEFFLALEFVSVGVDESIQLNPDMAVIRITDNDGQPLVHIIYHTHTFAVY